MFDVVFILVFKNRNLMEIGLTVFKIEVKNPEPCNFGTTYKMATSGAYNFGPEVATEKRFRILVVLDECY